MKKFHILFLVTLGFLLIPSITFACGKNQVKHSCKKEASSKNEIDDCCENSKHSGSRRDGCGGKCGHSSCGCASSCGAGIALLKEKEFEKPNILSYSKKQKFYPSGTITLSGFSSLWLIPKIS